ncbi:YhzD family protein [Alkalibacillus sp. S2W]|uniref:YhzD family protein n=1 Tax=Alkalibacillus sp. S2W TaxID=3386553 RepID=UPI00398CF0A9
MKTYFLTVFSQKGENLLDDTIEAQNDEEASKIGKERLAEHGYQDTTHRCVSPDGRLVLFHR